MVSNLFFNVPARRKFLKSNTTELNAIITEFERIALAHPEIAFKLYSDDALIFDLPVSSVRQRIVGIFGKRLDKELLPLEVDTTLVKLKGFVGLPESAKKKNAHQFFFVNGRYMRHSGFSKAVLTAYNHIIPEGEQIPFFLSMEVDPERIDVNIHPAKTEIKFQDESAIWQIILAAVRESLGKHNAIPTIDFDTENCPDIPAFNPTADYQPPTVEIDHSYNPFNDFQPSGSAEEKTISSSGAPRGASASRVNFPTSHEKFPTSHENFSAGFVNFPTSRADFSASHLENTQELQTPTLYEEASREEQHVWTHEDVSLFQYRDKYIVLPGKSGLMFVHQHRAHIRVLYNRYVKSLSQGSLPSQGLLFPEMVELTARQVVAVRNNSEAIERVGLDITSLGGNSFSINAIPAGVSHSDIHALVMSVVDGLLELADTKADKDKCKELLEDHAAPGGNVYHILALALAKQTAIKSNVTLHKDQMAELIEQLFTGYMPAHTPEGKLITATITDESVESLFLK